MADTNENIDCSSLEELTFSQTSVIDNIMEEYNSGGLFEFVTDAATVAIEHPEYAEAVDTHPQEIMIDELYHHQQEGSNHFSMLGIPETKNWKGDYDFDISFPKEKASSNKSNSYMYSDKLDKLFIAMNVSCIIEFQVSGPLYFSAIRAMAIYEKCDDIMLSVDRCPIHIRTDDPTNAGCIHRDHLIRCDSPDSRYFFDEASGRRSVVTPYFTPAAGMDSHRSIFKFMCLGSCIGGINRRPLQLIFTLEKEGRAVGRRVIHLRICACPARDMKTEETVQMKRMNGETRILKRTLSTETVTTAKKPKQGPNLHLHNAQAQNSQQVVLQQNGQPQKYTVTFVVESESVRDMLLVLKDNLRLAEECRRGFPPGSDNITRHGINGREQGGCTLSTSSRSETLTREEVQIKSEQMENVYSILESIGMGKYQQIFMNNKISSLSQVGQLTESDWQKFNIEQMHLKLIRAAFAKAANFQSGQDGQQELVCIQRVSFKRVTSLKREDQQRFKQE